MTQVCEKCDVLFRDHTLFSHPNTRAVDAERKTSNRLMVISIAMNSLILLILLIDYFRFAVLDMLAFAHILIYVLIGVLSFVTIVAAIIVRIVGRNHYLR